MNTAILRRIVKLKRTLRVLVLAEKVYLSGAIIFILALLLILPSPSKAIGLILLAVFTLIAGLLLEGYALVKKLWKTALGKLITSGVFTIGSTFTLAVSSAAVAHITGSNPSSFPYTVALQAFLIMPITIWLVLTVFASSALIFHYILAIPYLLVRFSIPHTFLASIFKKRKSTERPARVLTGSLRFIAITGFIAMLSLAGEYMKVYSKFIYNMSSSFLYKFEAYSNTYCDKNNESERFSYISSNLVLVSTHATDNTYKFETRKCQVPD